MGSAEEEVVMVVVVVVGWSRGRRVFGKKGRRALVETTLGDPTL